MSVAAPLRDRVVRSPTSDDLAKPAFAGSFRQRRGQVMARLRDGARVPVAELDAEALASLVADGLAVVTGEHARLP